MLFTFIRQYLCNVRFRVNTLLQVLGSTYVKYCSQETPTLQVLGQFLCNVWLTVNTVF